MVMLVFRTLPVYMNVLDAESGSSSNASAACWAATKALVVLMLRSREKFSTGRERGLLASLGVTAPAAAEFSSL